MDRWYVYELADPRDGSVFYVGKGQGGRAGDHLREARRAAEPSGAKQCRIADILKAGRLPLVLIGDSFEDEQDAIDAEARLIERHGIENLTNVCRRGAPSGAGAIIRRIIRTAKADIRAAASPELVRLGHECLATALALEAVNRAVRRSCPA